MKQIPVPLVPELKLLARRNLSGREIRMSLLRDQDLVASMEVKPPAVPYAAGVEMPADPYASDSPVQGSSIDLRIGHIYLPGKKKKDLGGVENPKSTHSLKTGHTA